MVFSEMVIQRHIYLKVGINQIYYLNEGNILKDFFIYLLVSRCNKIKFVRPH